MLTTKEKAKDKYLQKKYGITLQTYKDMLLKQNNSCDLCGKPASNFKRALHVDHNHKTNKVRGLVCFHCNKELIRRHSKKTATLLKDYMDRHEP